MASFNNFFSDSDYKVHIEQHPMGLFYKVFLYRVTTAGIVHYFIDGDTVKTEMVKEGTIEFPKPTLTVPGEFLQPFADALANGGVKTHNDHKNEGLLEATREHLADMRSLVFDKKGRANG